MESISSLSGNVTNKWKSTGMLEGAEEPAILAQQYEKAASFMLTLGRDIPGIGTTFIPLIRILWDHGYRNDVSSLFPIVRDNPPTIPLDNYVLKIRHRLGFEPT